MSSLTTLLHYPFLTNKWDLSINRYKEIVYEEVEYDAPSKILERIEKLNSDRMELNNKLYKLL